MTFGSVCSGIEAASVAWEPLGFQAAFYSEIDPFPSAVLSHHYPGVPNLGDFTTIKESPSPIDMLVGGTPCQSFSVAGLRKGMDDARGNLALEFLRLADRLRPRWLVWENVPGVLSSNGGRDFGAFLGGVAEVGYGFAYRVLDAQYFGVPQRRNRVFLVGNLGGWQDPAAVLFDRESLSGYSPPSREQGRPASSFSPGSIGGYSDRPGTLRASGGDIGPGSEFLVVIFGHQNSSSQGISDSENTSPTLDKSKTPAVMISSHTHKRIRKITPLEAERLQGFPDDWTLVSYRGKPSTDTPRYKAIGNSMAVPVMRWLGRRILECEALRLANRPTPCNP